MFEFTMQFSVLYSPTWLNPILFLLNFRIASVQLFDCIQLLKRILPPRYTRQSGIKASPLPAGLTLRGPTGVYRGLLSSIEFILSNIYWDNKSSREQVAYFFFPLIPSIFSYNL